MEMQGLTKVRLCELLKKMKLCKAVLIGDMCLDVYWFADMTLSKLSRETPCFPLPVVNEKMSAGAGGNAVVNLATLCDSVIPIGLIGNDWRGKCLCEVFENHGIRTDFLIKDNGIVTNAYCKPMRRGYAGVDVEDSRIDFEMMQPISKDVENELIEKLEIACQDADVLCVSDQFEYGCISERVREKINILARSGLLCIVDSRSRIGLYSDCVLKPNELECSRAVFGADALLDNCFDECAVRNAAQRLADKTNASVCLTLGERGCFILRNGECVRINAIEVAPPIDTVGAGDSFLAAFSLALAVGATNAEAGVIGSLASGVTVKKINTTGTASQTELISLMEREAK